MTEIKDNVNDKPLVRFNEKGFVLNSSGDMLLCEILNIKLGNVKDYDYDPIKILELQNSQYNNPDNLYFSGLITVLIGLREYNFFCTSKNTVFFIIGLCELGIDTPNLFTVPI